MPKAVTNGQSESGTSTEVEYRRPSSVALMREQLQIAASLPDQGSGAIMDDIQDRILAATSVDDVLAVANQGPQSVQNFVDIPLEVTGYRVLKSSPQFNDGGLGVFLAIAFVELLTGEEHVITAGGSLLVTQLHKIDNLDGFPFRAAFISVTTSSGFEVHKLRPLSATELAAIKNK